MKDQIIDLKKLKMEENKIFLSPGDIVELRQNIPNKPQMLVIRKVNSMFKNETGRGPLVGMKCIWFTTTGELQEGVFSTKDLIKVK